MTAGSGELARFAPAPGKLAVMAAGLVVFAAVAGWVLWITPAEGWEAEGAGLIRAALWAVVLICPLYAADIAARLVRGTPTLAASAEGMVLRTVFGIAASLRWDEVEMVAPVEMGRKPWLAIYLREPVATLGRLGLAARLMLAKSHGEGVPNFAFRTIQLGARPEEAAEVLEKIRQGRYREPGRAKRGRRGRRA